MTGELLSGLDELLSGLQLALGVDDFGAPQALGLGLLGDGADHLFVEVDVLEFNIGDFNAPRVGLIIEDLLDVLIEFFAFGQHLVQFMTADDRAQRRLS